MGPNSEMFRPRTTAKMRHGYLGTLVMYLLPVFPLSEVSYGY